MTSRSRFGPYDCQNIFARILQCAEPACVLFEDEIALAILDIFPQCTGHTLVMPKAADVVSFLDLPQPLVGPFMERVQYVAEGLMESLSSDGIEICQFNGAAAGQTVFHLHFHLLPRIANVPLLPHGGAPLVPYATLEHTASRIRAGLSRLPALRARRS